MELTIFLALFIISAIILVKSGQLVVKALAEMAAFLEVSEFILAFILMAFATSLPEIFVSISAALRRDSELAFGNVIGSNILYPTLLIGLVALLGRNLKIKGEVMNRDSLFASLIAFMPFLFMLDLELSRFEGLLIFIVFLIYFLRLLKRREVFRKVYTNVLQDDFRGLKVFFKSLIFFIVSVGLLIIAAQGVVEASTKMAILLNFPLILIGIFLVAFGVALPELVFSVKSIFEGRESMIAGNLFGSIVVNVGAGLAVAAMISPVILSNATYFYHAAFFSLASLLLFGFFARTQEVLSWKEGIILLWFYMAFVATGFLIK